MNTATLEAEAGPRGDAHQAALFEPVARIYGEPLAQLPLDLYIPPDALAVMLDAFEGPLDLLLYMIRRANIDILDIPMAPLTRQYLDYVETMRASNLELAAEYLVMAAMLCEIKSRMLLPRPPTDLGEEQDPRAELIRRLMEYERYKQAAEDIDALPRDGRDVWQASADAGERRVVRVVAEVTLKELMVALKDVMQRAQMFQHHRVQREPLSVRQRMSDVLATLQDGAFHDFVSLFDPSEGRVGVVVTFLAILELTKESLLEIVQAEAYSPIHVRAGRGGALAVEGPAE